MSTWDPVAACAAIKAVGWPCHKTLVKSAHFRLPFGAPGDLMIPMERTEIVSAYVNRQSVRGVSFPSAGIDGVEVRKHYGQGHTGKDGNPGIAASIIRHSPYLNPASNDVLLVSVRDEPSLHRLLDWYQT